MIKELKVSERRACTVLGQHRSTQRKRPEGRGDEDALTRTIIDLACQYGRYGYRRIHWLLEQQGWGVSLKRVKRIWRREGLKVPQKQPKRGRLWLNDGSCIRLRPAHKNHVWSPASAGAGFTTSFKTALTTARRSACSRLWMSTRASA